MGTFTDLLHSSIIDLKEKAAVAARIADEHEEKGHKALARSYRNAANRLRRELEDRIGPLGEVPALARPGYTFGFILGGLAALAAIDVFVSRQEKRARDAAEREEER
jgi:hypothetical protein